uniref:Histidine-containing phosphotransfer protein n=1 Tax=Kalanchoe fedtschenkoi TaxID=63787 RepID=A0A7N0TU62_KALFE
MDRSNQMHRQISAMRQSLFDQGYLDEQFIQLEELQDDDNPNFVEEVVTLYYRDSSRMLHNIEQALLVGCIDHNLLFMIQYMERGPYDFNKLDNFMHQFKGRSSSIGAKKIKSECGFFREYCRTGNGEGQTGPKDKARRPS